MASQSPRRRELIKGLDIPFEVAADFDVEETYPAELPIDEVAVFLAEKKSNSFPSTLKENEILLTADTIVKCDNALLGKPSDKNNAIEMLANLSGKRHEVITGTCLRSLHEKKLFSVSSYVYFSNLSSKEINYYVDKYVPLDKAGAYGIQEWIGYIAIEKIEGSYYNVMGLPVSRIWKEITTFIK